MGVSPKTRWSFKLEESQMVAIGEFFEKHFGEDPSKLDKDKLENENLGLSKLEDENLELLRKSLCEISINSLIE